MRYICYTAPFILLSTKFNIQMMHNEGVYILIPSYTACIKGAKIITESLAFSGVYMYMYILARRNLDVDKIPHLKTFPLKLVSILCLRRVFTDVLIVYKKYN